MIACACGCGRRFTEKDSRGRARSYVPGHHRRGKSNTWKIKAVVNWWTSHERARKLKCDENRCEWESIGGCKGRLEVAHVDGDAFNNECFNLKKLCRAHHRLMDNGRIDPKRPVMVSFYVSKDGKRRYAEA